MTPSPFPHAQQDTPPVAKLATLEEEKEESDDELTGSVHIGHRISVKGAGAGAGAGAAVAPAPAPAPAPPVSPVGEGHGSASASAVPVGHAEVRVALEDHAAPHGAAHGTEHGTEHGAAHGTEHGAAHPVSLATHPAPPADHKVAHVSAPEGV
jgi:hypothetical protein